MARYGQRPENALKRANEFIEVGKPARALDTLQEVFRNKKWAYNWSETILEPIMFKYLDLCVELKKSHIAKEGLFQYRNLFQSVNVGSLENVIRGYLRMAEERTENAREQSAQAVIDIDDLDNLATPESILLSAVSGEDAQDRSDRTILTPWVKFLWESYCQCLELLRTNAHVESLYHDIARMAFQFCLKYNRKTEFRKLCDKLRKHLDDICKLPAQVANVCISKPETQQLNLETRLHQLDFAIQMELWQEAYKAIEDIHNLMNMSKKMPVPKTMANYYQKLAMVFWKAGNYLFHAAALLKLFQLSREMKKNITQEELQRMACRVLLATLSIPLPSAHPEFDRFIETDKSPLEKAQRLAVLLGLFQPPTRASLLKDLVRVNVVNLATPQLQDLYNWLEVEFHPLLLCTRIQNVIKSVLQEENSSLQQYVKALQDVTLVRLVKQIAQVYQTIEFNRLIELACFSTPFHMERLLVDCVRFNDMQVRIDHGKKCIHFGMDLSESQREDKPEGPTLQVMPSEQIRNQLVNMSIVLHQAINVIDPQRKKQERDRLRNVMVQNYHDNKLREHQKILQRHKIIEDRKEYIERLNTVREEEEQRRQEEIQRQQQLAEQKRLEQEREERERKRALNEIQQIKDRHLKEKLQQISQTGHGQKILKKLDEDDIKKLDADQIAAKEVEELQKERRELQAKLKSQEKKVDYFERAKRLEEIPLLQAAIKERQEKDQKFWEQHEQERIAAEIEERKLAVSTRDRLLRMKPDKDAFLEKLKKERNIVYEDKLKEFEEMIALEREKRLYRRKVERKEDRRIQWHKEKERYEQRKRDEQRKKEEEERQRLEEIARKEREEREKVEREERERKQREDEEMRNRVAAKQKARDEEVERKLRERERMFSEQNKGSEWRKDDKKNKGGGRGDKDERDYRSRPAPDETKSNIAETASSWRKSDTAKISQPTTLQTTASSETKKSEPYRPGRFRSGTEETSLSHRATDGLWRSDRIEEKKDEEKRRDDDRLPIRSGFNKDRKEERGGDKFSRGLRSRDDDRERGFKRDDERSFKRDDERSFKRDDERSFKRDDERSFKRDDERSFKRDDERSFKKDDDKGSRREEKEHRSFKRDDERTQRKDEDNDFRRGNLRRVDDRETSGWRDRGRDDSDFYSGRGREDRDENRGSRRDERGREDKDDKMPKKDDREKDDAPTETSWRSVKKTEDEPPSSGLYRHPRRDGPREMKEKEVGREHQVKRAGAGAGDNDKTASKEKVREQPEKQTEDADGWSTVHKRR